jgi:hypothetical protein
VTTEKRYSAVVDPQKTIAQHIETVVRDMISYRIETATSEQADDVALDVAIYYSCLEPEIKRRAHIELLLAMTQQMEEEDALGRDQVLWIARGLAASTCAQPAEREG